MQKIFFAATVIYVVSCSKSNPAPGGGATNLPPDPCSGKTITITETTTESTGCESDGSITVSAAGSTNFSYKLNSGGSYQASGVFSNLTAGIYTVFAKDGGGCEKLKSVTVTSNAVTGALFSAVKNLIQSKCQSCHNNAVQNGGRNWADDCNIVAGKDRIKVRAVDEGTMPPGGALSQAEKDIITNWINAGGKITD